MEQTTAVAESIGIQAPVVPRWAWGVTMNMMYSDYYAVAAEFGVDRPEFYAALAQLISLAFLVSILYSAGAILLVQMCNILHIHRMPKTPESVDIQRKTSNLNGLLVLFLWWS